MPPPQAFHPGDLVTWNGRYRGKVQHVIGDEAVVVEQAGPLGRTVLWRLALAALTRLPALSAF
jgi:hypothetical protein